MLKFAKIAQANPSLALPPSYMQKRCAHVFQLLQPKELRKPRLFAWRTRKRFFPSRGADRHDEVTCTLSASGSRPLWHSTSVLTATDTHCTRSQVVHAGRWSLSCVRPRHERFERQTRFLVSEVRLALIPIFRHTCIL